MLGLNLCCRLMNLCEKHCEKFSLYELLSWFKMLCYNHIFRCGKRMRKIIYDKELKWKLSPSNDEYFDQVGKKMGSCLIKLWWTINRIMLVRTNIR
jgi:hypothetical protein